MAFQKGQGGRPKGLANKATREAKALCGALVDNPAYQKSFKARFIAGELAPALEAMVWYYAKGKPLEELHHSGAVTFQVVTNVPEADAD